MWLFLIIWRNLESGGEVDTFLSASGYLGDNIHPFFTALPKGRRTISNEQFRRQICQVDIGVLRHLRDNVKGGFNEEKYGLYIGFSCEITWKNTSNLNFRWGIKKQLPAILVLLEQRCSEMSMDLARLDCKITSNIWCLSAPQIGNASCCFNLHPFGNANNTNLAYLTSILMLLTIHELELTDTSFVHESVHYLMEQLTQLQRYGGKLRMRNKCIVVLAAGLGLACL
jgi:hypothetical protein